MKHRHLTWDSIESDVRTIHGKLVARGTPIDAIVAVLRGGAIPARMLMDLLDRPIDLCTVTVRAYGRSNERNDRPLLVSPLTARVCDKNVLVIDDIADTGGTLGLVLAHARDYQAKTVCTATLYWKERAALQPDVYANQADDDEWLVFPWEKREFERDTMGAHGDT